MGGSVPRSGQRPLRHSVLPPSHSNSESLVSQQSSPGPPHLSQTKGLGDLLQTRGAFAPPWLHRFPGQHIFPFPPHASHVSVMVLHPLPSLHSSPGQHFWPVPPQSSHSLDASLQNRSCVEGSSGGQRDPEQQTLPATPPHEAHFPVAVLQARVPSAHTSPGQHCCPSSPQTSHWLASELQKRIWSGVEPGHFSPAQQASLRPPQSSQRPVTVLQT